MLCSLQRPIALAREFSHRLHQPMYRGQQTPAQRCTKDSERHQ